MRQITPLYHLAQAPRRRSDASLPARSSATESAWMIACGLAVGVMLSLLTYHEPTRLEGHVDQLRIWNRVLSPEGIAAMRACPEGEELASITMNAGFIVGGKCRPVER